LGIAKHASAMTSDSPFPPGSSLIAYFREYGGDQQDLYILYDF
jgi:hypothetical protein